MLVTALPCSVCHKLVHCATEWCSCAVQIVDGKQAGAAGILGVITTVIDQRSASVCSELMVCATQRCICAVQIVDAKQAGAAGILGVITAVVSHSTSVMSSFACVLGMDCPVEVRLPSQLRV